METLDYIHTHAVEEIPESIDMMAVKVNFNFFKDLNWKKLSSDTAMRFLPIALILAVVSIAGQAQALQQGSSGPDVKNIQRCLRRLGYFSGPENGNFGSLTKNAVTKYQQANGLSTIGIVGPQTEKLLQSQCHSTRRDRNIRGPERVSSSRNISGNLQLGSRGSAVSQLQENLRRLGLYHSQVTGYFGPETQQALIAFQQSHGIRPDGIVGARTQENIRISLNQPSTQGVGGDAVPNALNQGDRGVEVSQLQQSLQQLGYLKVNPSGYFGPVTREAVARFQRDNGLYLSGVADSQTLAAISRSLQISANSNTSNSYSYSSQNGGNTSSDNYSYSSQNGGNISSSNYNYSSQNDGNTSSSYNYNSSSTCSSINRDICLGERSQRVTILQQRLQALGFFNGNVTGYFGPATKDAVTQFQRAYNISPTGLVNYETYRALKVNNSDYPTAGNNGNSAPNSHYVVVVPVSNNDTLYKVQQFVPAAFLAKSRLGAYVNAGQFREPTEAERLSKQLRARGLDARVNYL
ncbi:MAG: peptidoglycan-binding protein [Rhizonema sp. NSF051]|nr:peptidoglycan-binding protein [Rhizonema sp. NSF051]